MDFKIVTGFINNGQGGIQSKVKAELNAGYTLVGGPFKADHLEGYGQALVKALPGGGKRKTRHAFSNNKRRTRRN